MKVLVTGGAGFIGSCLVKKLNSVGISDIVICDNLGKSEKWKNLVGKKYNDYIDKLKLFDELDKIKSAKYFDLILHMGACTSTTESNAQYMMENNFVFSKRLAQWSLKKKAHFLYASSAATYGSGEKGYDDNDEVSLKLTPLNVYGYSKQLFDEWVINNNLNKKFTGFKFFNVFGPNEYHKQDMRSVICKVFPIVKSGQPMRLFKSYNSNYKDGQQQRDFVYVKDVVEVVYYFIENLGKKGIYNLGTGKARSWNDIANALFAALDKQPKIEYIEMDEVLKDKYQYFTEANLFKLRKAGCKHKFMSLEDAIKDYVGYLSNQSYF